MATASSILSEEQFLCPVCLDVFTEPVTTPCGHNYCKGCIQKYWDSNDRCQCPICKEQFLTRPELRVNTFVSEMAAQFKMAIQETTALSQGDQHLLAGVPCDICTESKHEAFKSCLVCLTSYCLTHLEPHRRVTSLKKHRLAEPVWDLESRMCLKHGRLLELFCKKDQACVCVLCIQTDHKNHTSVPVEQEYGERTANLDVIVARVKQMINVRSQKIADITRSGSLNKRRTDQEMSDITALFTSLGCMLGKSQDELMKVVEEKQRASGTWTEDVIGELEQEIGMLKSRCTELEQLSHINDHLTFLQTIAFQRNIIVKKWSNVSLDSDLCVGDLRRAVSQLKNALNQEIDRELKLLCEAELSDVRRYAVEVTLDPKTAQAYLILSQDGKAARTGNNEGDLPNNPERFENVVSVLGEQGFAAGRFYYEVQVKDKTDWVVGVAKESINRKKITRLSPWNGYWTVLMEKRNTYKALAASPVFLSLKGKPQRIGVFVDYEEGQVSFYDVLARSHIYSFTGCTFGERLYPYLCPQLGNGGANSAPLIITPVNLQARFQ